MRFFRNIMCAICSMNKITKNGQNTNYNNDNYHHNNLKNNNQHTNHTVNQHITQEQRHKAKATAETNMKKAKNKKRSRDKSDHGADFVAPDGGWGWLVAIAGGINVLVTFSLVQNFGIIYRERMQNLGITSTELTTILNIEIAMTTITGLLNGPLFRRFTFRQIALMGSLLIFMGTFLSILANSFIFYVCSISILYGVGRGVIVSSSIMAVNTYFKQCRRTAMAYLFGVAGVGPIFLPYLATYLMQLFGMDGTVLIFSGISLHTFACSLIFQPVKWHVKKSKDALKQEAQQRSTTPQNEHKIETTSETFENQQHCNELVHQHPAELTQNKANEPPQKQDVQEQAKKRSFYRKIIIFFDLDLLLDITYVNLAFGLTLIFFVETNFGALTPFILNDFSFTNNQIAIAMSLFGLSDLAIRFLIPVITAKISFSNKTYLICGVIGISLGRVMLTVTRNFYMMLAVFFWMGVNKALRVVFWSLILADYMPLKRLPAAVGLQLMMSSLFTLAVGPLIGLIRDKINTAYMVNFLNVLYILPIFGCILEAFCRKKKYCTKTTIEEDN